MRVLVTGAFGYLGLAVVRRLEADGHAVVAVGRAPRPACAEAVKAAIPPTVEQQPGDVRSLTRAGLRSIEAVVHLAGGGASGGKLYDPAAELRDNVEGARHVADIVPPSARRLLASSVYVYGTTPRPAKETDPLAPDTLYGQLKAIAEALFQQHKGTALRLAHVYGVGAGVDLQRDGVTERLARAAAGGAPFVLQGDGSQRIDLVHVDDACDAVARALTAEHLPPAVNVGGGAPVAVADLARAFGVDPCIHAAHVIEEPMDLTQPPPSHLAGVALLTAQTVDRENGPYQAHGGRWVRWGQAQPAAPRVLDISLAGVVLDWRPRVSLAEGARGLIEWIRGAR